MITISKVYIASVLVFFMLSFISQAFAFDELVMRQYRSAQQYKKEHAGWGVPKEYNPETQILDYSFTFGSVAHGSRGYSPINDPDLLLGYMNGRTSFRQKDELRYFPRGEWLSVRWKYKRKVYQDTVDLKQLLKDEGIVDGPVNGLDRVTGELEWREHSWLYEATSGFQLSIKVLRDQLYVYKSYKFKNMKQIYPRVAKL